jgi:hypothetical protein
MIRAVVGMVGIVLGMVASAQADGGWYLMARPILQGVDPYDIPVGEPRVAVEKPMSMWQQFGEFDSARECKTALGPNILRVTDIAKEGAGLLDLMWQQTMKSRCIASNDPRLGGPR